MLNRENMVGAALTEQEKEFLSDAADRGGLEFEKAKETIRVSRGGNFPPNWFDEVICSGFIAEKIAAWTSPRATFTYMEWGPHVHQGYLEESTPRR